MKGRRMQRFPQMGQYLRFGHKRHGGLQGSLVIAQWHGGQEAETQSWEVGAKGGGDQLE